MLGGAVGAGAGAVSVGSDIVGDIAEGQSAGDVALNALKKGLYMHPEDLRILLEYYPEIMNVPLLADFINEISDNDEL